MSSIIWIIIRLVYGENELKSNYFTVGLFEIQWMLKNNSLPHCELVVVTYRNESAYTRDLWLQGFIKNLVLLVLLAAASVFRFQKGSIERIMVIAQAL